MPDANKQVRFYRSGQRLEIRAYNSYDDAPERVILLAALPGMRSGDMSSNYTAREFPARLREGAEAMDIGIQLIDGIAKKLQAQGYAVVMDGDASKLDEGQEFRPDVYANIMTGPGKKVDGLEAAIEKAYEEVLRENKALAAYMSKGQGAKRGA